MEQDQTLIDLIVRGYESPEVDYKGPMSWNEKDKNKSCEIVKDILAMANSKGGFLIIGVSEKNGTFEPEGLNDDQVKSFESTRLANFVQRYADPPINVTMQVVENEGKRFVIIQIPLFSAEPHICTKDYPSVLSTPTFYITPNVKLN